MKLRDAGGVLLGFGIILYGIVQNVNKHHEAVAQQEAAIEEAKERRKKEEIERENEKRIAAEQARLAEEAEKQRRIEQAAREAKWVEEKRIWIGMTKKQLLKSQGVPLSIIASDSAWSAYMELWTYPKLHATVKGDELVDYTLYAD